MSTTYFQMFEKKRTDKANVVKRQHLGNLGEGYMGILCTSTCSFSIKY